MYVVCNIIVLSIIIFVSFFIEHTKIKIEVTEFIISAALSISIALACFGGHKTLKPIS